MLRIRLQKDEPLRLLQPLQDLRKERLPAGQVFYAGVLVIKLLAAALHIVRQTPHLGTLLPQSPDALQVLMDVPGRLLADFIQHGPCQTVAPVHADKQIEGNRENRGQHNEDDPGYFYGRIRRFIHNRQRDGQTNQKGDAVDQRAAQLPEAEKQQQKLRRQQENDNCRAAKDQAA